MPCVPMVPPAGCCHWDPPPPSAEGRRRYGRYARRVLSAASVHPLLVADVTSDDGEDRPVYVHVVDHPDGRVLVDTGMTELHEYGAELAPRLHPLTGHDLDLATIDLVVLTHLHFDHCDGAHD